GASLLALRDGKDVPEDGYRGSYVAELAADLPPRLVESAGTADDPAVVVGQWASERVRAGIEASLERLGVHFDVWKTEGSLHREGWVERAVAKLREAGYVYERDGATWFRSTDFGDDKDRVIYRSNGQPTYFAAFIGSRGHTPGIAVDIELATEQSNENPVYYVQYAHARIASILRKAGETGLSAGGSIAGALSDEPEPGLTRAVARLPDVVEDAA